ncbi:MAG TPA: MGMT family protein [Candidatus Nanoarchaeia archaeon]|nr:MGMT family protein [Candidatus Nanoarchaeia archaeon]
MNFNQKVWNLCKKIPVGRVSTYKILAKSLRTKAYRAVGNALRDNPHAPLVPCHRIINSDGTIGGYKGKKNSKEKSRLLKKEGIKIVNKKVDPRFIFSFS